MKTGQKKLHSDVRTVIVLHPVPPYLAPDDTTLPRRGLIHSRTCLALRLHLHDDVPQFVRLQHEASSLARGSLHSPPRGSVCGRRRCGEGAGEARGVVLRPIRTSPKKDA